MPKEPSFCFFIIKTTDKPITICAGFSMRCSPVLTDSLEAPPLPPFTLVMLWFMLVVLFALT